MTAESLPQFTVGELNAAIGNLLERGFAPRFLVQATVSKPQIKKGHLWMTLTDGDFSITAVTWASKLRQLSYRPNDGDGVTIVGKLNFWSARASLAVQVLDIRPSLTTVLRQFETVRGLLERDGVINEQRKRPLPSYPGCIAILTSVPSSALADMLRTARERWPLTRLLIIPIPVQGGVAAQIQAVLSRLAEMHQELNLDAIVLARGGGSREDLMVFDDEQLCRDLALFPIPVVTGLGHEDDLTVADLVADLRCATPTAAIVSLLPNRETALSHLLQRRKRLQDHRRWVIVRERQRLAERRSQWHQLAPILEIQRQRIQLKQRHSLLQAFSPSRWLKRGFAIVHDDQGKAISSVTELKRGKLISIQLCDGEIHAVTEAIHPDKTLP